MLRPGRSSLITSLLKKYPGKERFGEYRFLPVFIVIGGLLEFSMIKWTVGETNFYRTYRKRQVLNELDELRKKVEKERKAVILKSAVDNS